MQLKIPKQEYTAEFRELAVKRLTDAQMLALIRAIHAELKGAYGSPRITEELRARGFPAGKARVERLMRENGIRGRHKRRYKATTDSKHTLTRPVSPRQSSLFLNATNKTLTTNKGDNS
jgi:transposase InsO family protein